LDTPSKVGLAVRVRLIHITGDKRLKIRKKKKVGERGKAEKEPFRRYPDLMVRERMKAKGRNEGVYNF